MPEILTPEERREVVAEILDMRKRYPKLDMSEGLTRAFNDPPDSPKNCIFARTTETISADLKTRIKPCQFGGDPDCSQCGCVASAGLAAVGRHKLAGFIPVGAIFGASVAIGATIRRMRSPAKQAPPFPIVQ